MEYTVVGRDCPICGNNPHEIVWNKYEERKIFGKTIIDARNNMIHGLNVICVKCGHIYEKFPMSPECLDKFYSNKNDQNISPYRKIYDYTMDSIKFHFSHALIYLKQNGFDHFQSWLDVGSGDSYITEEINRVSKRGFSYDNSFTHEWNLKSKEMLNRELSKEKFDFVSCMNVLEHVFDPVNFLEELKSYIKDDGKLVICVPYVYTKLITMPRDQWFSNAHIHAFSCDSLINACNLAGLQVIDTTIIAEEMGEKIFVCCVKNENIDKNLVYFNNKKIDEIVEMFKVMNKFWLLRNEISFK